jgi:DNA-binding transcriptional ArsR family regulator
MDTRKDIQNTNGFPVLGRGVEATNALIGKKCERLATALYLVTSFLSDTEPMKARLRTLSLELVRDASNVRYGATVAGEVSVLEAIRANIGETLSLLELAFVAGLISEMNFSILKREYGNLRDKTELKKASRDSVSDVILGNAFFSGDENVDHAQKYLAPKQFTVPQSSTQTSIGHTKGHTAPQVSYKEVARSMHEEGGKSAEARITPQVAQTPRANKTDKGHEVNKVIDVARDSRKARILKLVKDNGEVTIKDITNYFPELSEKTIQRELIAFVDSGVLKKTGERRWSRYSLA